MPTWVPDDRDALDALAADLVATFTQAEARLRKQLMLALRPALKADGQVKLMALTEARRVAQQLVTDLQTATPRQIREILDTAAHQGALAALTEMSPLGVATTALPGTGAAAALLGDLTSAVDNVTQRILRWPDDVWRHTVAQSATDVLLGLGTTRTAQARAWQQLLAKGVGGIVDKAGRRWNLATYVEMATRTATRRAWEAQHTTTMLAHGMNLVSIVVGSGACERCAEWAGKILRIDAGPTGTLEVPSIVANEMVTVDVAGTLDDAKEQGWQHPHCRCRPAAYLPGLSVVTDATTYDPELEAQQARQRALEREVRKAKAEAQAAFDPEQKKAADRAVRDAQTAAREHAEETGAQRRKYREQLDLGHDPTPDGPTATRRDSLPSMMRVAAEPATLIDQAVSGIVAQARRAEPAITTAITGAAKKAGASLDGLAQRLKATDSLRRKLTRMSARIPIGEAAKRVNDAVRYRAVANAPSYAETVRSIDRELRSSGFALVKVTDLWGDSRYRGLNVTYRHGGTLFEVQFHTPESLAAATSPESRRLYERARIAKGTERREIDREIKHLWANISRPPGSWDL